MRRKVFKAKNNKSTVSKRLFIVFFCIVLNALIIFNIYGKSLNKNTILLVNEKLDKIIYQFFNDLITDKVINEESVNNILDITKNNNGEILAVNYNLEKTYAILTQVSTILKEGIYNLEKGQITLEIDDKYLKSSPKGLILNVPIFLNSQNVFFNNWGPMIPILINFNENLLTNIKTKVTNYGFNNALLEVYITVEMQKLLITPLHQDTEKLSYDILVGSLVINGRVPEFYGDYEVASAIFNIPFPEKV